MSSLTDKNQGHQNPGQNQQGETRGKPIQQEGSGGQRSGQQQQGSGDQKHHTSDR